MNRKKFSDFIRYDNTLPFFFILIFIGASSSFALSQPEVQSALLNPVTKVLSVDNTYIANVDLTSYSPKVTITNVLEDDSFYTVVYSFETIEIVDYVWKPTVISRNLKVDKNVLGKFKDLGVFVTEELKQVIDQEKQRLLATQEIEKRNISQKIVSTEYTGLIGKLLDDNTETLPGYVPVVTEVPTDTINNVENERAVTKETSQDLNISTENSNVNVQLVGNSVESVLVGETYTDKGVFVNNAVMGDVNTTVNGEAITLTNLDTSEPRIYKILYIVNTDKGIFNLERELRVVSATVPEVMSEANTSVNVETTTENTGETGTSVNTQEEAPTQIENTNTEE